MKLVEMSGIMEDALLFPPPRGGGSVEAFDTAAELEAVIANFRPRAGAAPLKPAACPRINVSAMNFRPRAGAAPLKRRVVPMIFATSSYFRPRAGAAPLKHERLTTRHAGHFISAPARGRLR